MMSLFRTTLPSALKRVSFKSLPGEKVNNNVVVIVLYCLFVACLHSFRLLYLPLVLLVGWEQGSPVCSRPYFMWWSYPAAKSSLIASTSPTCPRETQVGIN